MISVPHCPHKPLQYISCGAGLSSGQGQMRPLPSGGLQFTVVKQGMQKPIVLGYFLVHMWWKKIQPIRASWEAHHPGKRRWQSSLGCRQTGWLMDLAMNLVKTFRPLSLLISTHFSVMWIYSDPIYLKVTPPPVFTLVVPSWPPTITLLVSRPLHEPHIRVSHN